MPTYEYECPKCGSRVEIEQSISNRIPPLCCEDGCNVEMTVVIGPTSFVLKGGGWAKDGYGSKKA